MTSTAQALADGRQELHEHLTIVTGLGAELNLSSKPFSAVRAAIDEVEIRVVVVGEVNRGKSTFLNALMGAKVFPPRATVCTAVLTELRDGVLGAEVEHRDGTCEPVSLRADDIAASLRSTVSKKNPNAEKLCLTRLWFPNEFAADGVVLVDTPGVNDPVEWRERLTRTAVQQADAAIFLFDPQTPMRMSERTFLQEAVHYRVEDRVLFILNKKDQVSEEDLEHAQERLSRVLAEVVKSPRILAVASKPALAAKLKGDDSGLKASGFAACERVLHTFLVEERVALALTARRGSIAHLGLQVGHTLNLLFAGLTTERSGLESRVRKARRKLSEEERRVRADLARMEAEAIRMASNIQEAAKGAWKTSVKRHLLGEEAEQCVLAAFQRSGSEGRGEVRDRMGRARREAERTLASQFEALDAELNKRAQNQLQALDSVLDEVQTSIAGANQNPLLDIAEGAFKVSGQAISQAGGGLDDVLAGVVVGAGAAIFGLVAGFFGLVATVMNGAQTVDPVLPVRFLGDIAAQANALRASRVRAVKTQANERIQQMNRTLKAVVETARADTATLECERRRLQDIAERLSAVMGRLG
jgi:hypothetical protein